MADTGQVGLRGKRRTCSVLIIVPGKASSLWPRHHMPAEDILFAHPFAEPRLGTGGYDSAFRNQDGKMPVLWSATCQCESSSE